MLSKPFLKYETRIKMCHNFSDFIMSTLQILSRHDLTTQIDLNIKPTAALWTYRSSCVISAKYGITTISKFFAHLIKEMLTRAGCYTQFVPPVFTLTLL